MSNRAFGWGRRDFLQVAAAAGFAVSARGGAATETSETEAHITPQPTPPPEGDVNTSDILVETLIDWGATHVFGIVGDGINSIIEALRKRQDRIRYVAVRHEEAAAFMASGFAKHSGRLALHAQPGSTFLLFMDSSSTGTTGRPTARDGRGAELPFARGGACGTGRASSPRRGNTVCRPARSAGRQILT
jgi:Thiamine pyrophosphate enzyme, N-terminal TPP binding domain